MNKKIAHFKWDIIAVVIWLIARLITKSRCIFLPSPIEVFGVLVRSLVVETYIIIGWSILRIIIGLIFAFITGVIFGILAFYNKYFIG